MCSFKNTSGVRVSMKNTFKVRMWMPIEQFKKYRYRRGGGGWASLTPIEGAMEIRIDEFQLSLQRVDDEGNPIPDGCLLIDPEF